MSYFFFFYNIILGLFSAFMRILKGMLLGVIFISRIDRTSLMQGFQAWDKGKEHAPSISNLQVAEAM